MNSTAVRNCGNRRRTQYAVGTKIRIPTIIVRTPQSNRVREAFYKIGVIEKLLIGQETQNSKLGACREKMNVATSGRKK